MDTDDDFHAGFSGQVEIGGGSISTTGFAALEMFELSYGWRDTGGMWHFRHNDTASHYFRRKKVDIMNLKMDKTTTIMLTIRKPSPKKVPCNRWLRDRCWRN